MDLRTFVAETLSQIVGGVSDAQRTITSLDTNASVNPTSVAQSSRRRSAQPSPVEFDVALTIMEAANEHTNEDVTKQQGVISVVNASQTSITSETRAKESAQEAVSRIKFTVMLAQPADVDVRPDPNIAGIGRRLA